MRIRLIMAPLVMTALAICLLPPIGSHAPQTMEPASSEPSSACKRAIRSPCASAT